MEKLKTPKPSEPVYIDVGLLVDEYLKTISPLFL